MEEQITNELIQYKTGFIAGKNDIIELAKLGKVINLNELEKTSSTEWYDFGYQDSIDYFSNQLSKNNDILTIRVSNIVKELFTKRVIEYNSKKGQEIPMSTFKINL